MNNIIVLGNKNNNYLVLTFKLLKLKFNTITSIEELKNTKLDNNYYSLIINSETIIHKDFNINLYDILNYKDNLIVGYDGNLNLGNNHKFNNILNNIDTVTIQLNQANLFTDKLVKIENNINNTKYRNFEINSIIIKNELVNSFIEKNNEKKDYVLHFKDLLNYITCLENNTYQKQGKLLTIFPKITNVSYFKKVIFNNGTFIINNSNNYLFGLLKKKTKLDDYTNNNIIASKKYFNYDNYNTLINLYWQNIFNTNISKIIIFNSDSQEIIKILSNIKKSYLNAKCNNITIITEEENKENIQEFITNNYLLGYNKLNFVLNNNNINLIIKELISINYGKDVYLLSSSKISLNNITQHLLKKFSNCHINYENICFKYNNCIVKFFKLIPILTQKYLDSINIDNFNTYEYLSYLQKILFLINKTYFPDTVFYNNINYHKTIKNELINIDNFKLQYDENLLEFLYDNNEFDLIFNCISYILKNKLPSEQSIIFKYIAISPYTNYNYSANDYQNLFNLLSLENVEEYINIFNILYFNEKNNETINILLNVFEKKIDISNENIILYCVLMYYSSMLEKEIDITNDIKILKILIDNLDIIKNNINIEIKKINETIAHDTIYNSLINFILLRVNLLDTEYIDKFNTLYYNNEQFKTIDKMDNDEIEELIFNNFNSSINMGLCLSEVMMTTDDILLQRENSIKYVNNLKGVLEEDIDDINIKTIDLNLLFKLLALFKYSYHGIPNKDFFTNSKICFEKLFKLKLISMFKDEITNLVNNNVIMDVEDNFYNYEFKDTNPKKILFISEFLDRKHSVFKDRHQVISYLANNGYDVYVATTAHLNYQFSNIFKGIKENIVLNNNCFNVLDNLKKIRSYNFDKVVFCEVGMSLTCNLLSFFKLGRVTFNTWGHSDTSGGKYIDYYVSSKYYELPYPEAQEHYSEKLILQNGLCTVYVNPTKGYDLKIPRTYFGLSKHDKIILCPQSLFKIYPDYDEYLFEILYRLPEVNIVFVDAMDKKYKMYERWDNKMDEKYYGILSRVKFIPGIDHEKFVNLINNSDIMLDPFPFGGCNTSFEGLACGVPIVTQRADVINGRFTAGFYEYMGFTELIAKDKEDYINLTCKLINDISFYQHCVKQIKDKSDKIFMDQQTLDEWKELMDTY